MRMFDAIDQMMELAQGFVGRWLTYEELIADLEFPDLQGSDIF